MSELDFLYPFDKKTESPLFYVRTLSMSMEVRTRSRPKKLTFCHKSLQYFLTIFQYYPIVRILSGGYPQTGWDPLVIAQFLCNLSSDNMKYFKIRFNSHVCMLVFLYRTAYIFSLLQRYHCQ